MVVNAGPMSALEWSQRDSGCGRRFKRESTHLPMELPSGPSPARQIRRRCAEASKHSTSLLPLLLLDDGG